MCFSKTLVGFGSFRSKGGCAASRENIEGMLPYSAKKTKDMEVANEGLNISRAPKIIIKKRQCLESGNFNLLMQSPSGNKGPYGK